MAFNLQKFQQTTFTPREAAVPVPDLAAFFDKGDAVWRVRGLTAAEFARCMEAASRNRSRAAMAEGLMSGEHAAQVEAMRELLGIGDAVPDEIAKRLEMLVIASVAPAIDHAAAVRLANAFPIEFYQITNKVQELTGQGAEPGKKQPSRATRQSGQQ